MTNQFQFSLLFSVSFLFTNTLFAQQNVLKVTPIQPVLGKFTLSYEHIMKPRTTVLVEYQRWFDHRQSGVGLFVIGIPATASESNTNKGYRISFLARKYTKTALNGSFFEGGAYIGKHNITTRSETSILLPDPDFFFFPSYHNSVEETEYKDVRVAGLRVGGGWQKAVGAVTFECSAGINLNGFNDKGVRPTLGMKPVSPYGRLAVGVKF